MPDQVLVPVAILISTTEHQLEVTNKRVWLCSPPCSFYARYRESLLFAPGVAILVGLEAASA